MPKMDFLGPQEAEKINDQIGNSFGGHPVLLHIFKVKDKNYETYNRGEG